MKKKRDIYPSTDGEREEMIHEIVNTFVKDDAPEWVRKLIIDNLRRHPIEDWWFKRLNDYNFGNGANCEDEQVCKSR